MIYQIVFNALQETDKIIHLYAVALKELILIMINLPAEVKLIIRKKYYKKLNLYLKKIKNK